MINLSMSTKTFFKKQKKRKLHGNSILALYLVVQLAMGLFQMEVFAVDASAIKSLVSLRV